MSPSNQNVAVFDTNIIIDWLNGNSHAVRLFRENAIRVISRITFAEVLVGYKNDTTRKMVAELLKSSLEIDDTDEETALIAVKARIDTKIAIADAFIYAAAIVRQCTVYSRNPKDFEKAGLDASHVNIPYNAAAVKAEEEEVVKDARFCNAYDDLIKDAALYDPQGRRLENASILGR